MLSAYLLSLAITLVCTTTVFAVACIKKNNSILDIAYGPIFILTASILSFLSATITPIPPHTAAILLFIYIWGIRLAIRTYAKSKDKTGNSKYNAWREKWTKNGKAYFYIRSYLQIFILQAIVISIVLLPLTLTLSDKSPFMSLSFIGMVLWVIGFFFESIGDRQLDRFLKSTNAAKGMILKTGLWKYTRHPNYFGESSMWWGIALIAFSVSGNAIVFLSPMLITYLLLYVSGIPLIEKKWKGYLEWEVYKAKTSPFLPLPPK